MELLASVFVLIAVGAVVLGIITSSLRGGTKTTTIENIRQNGNHALSQISKNIQYARIFNGLSTNGVNYVTSCPFSSAPIPTPVTTSYSYIKVTPFNSSPIVYQCTSSTIFSNGNSLIDDVDSISMTECVIACVQARATDIPVIRIGFKLGPKNPSNNLVENITPPILFETSLTIRNYKK